MDTSSYTFEDLKTKYSGFCCPCTEVLLDGTALDAKYIVVETEAENTIETESVCSAVFKVQSSQELKPGEFPVLSDFPLLQKTEIKMGFQGKLVSVFQGYIFERELSFSGGEPPCLKVTCLDNKAFLRMNTSCQTFSEKTKLSELADDLLKNYSFSKEITATPALAKKMTLFCAGQTDFEIMCRMAEETGYEFFAHKDKLYFRKPMSVSGNLIELNATDILSLKAKTSAAGLVSNVNLYGFNQDAGEAVSGTADAVTAKVGSGDTCTEILSEHSAVWEANIHMTAGSSKTLDDPAKVFLQRKSMSLTTLTFATPGLPEMIPGRLMALGEIEKDLKNTYYIRSVRHSQRGSNYTTEMTCISNTTRK